MSFKRRTINDVISDVSFQTPHLWILGAGASVAAFPQGEKGGRRLPLMNNLTEVVGLQQLLDDHRIDHRGRDFEDVYSDLGVRPDCQQLCRDLELTIVNYFSALELPDEPCLYDYLVWSLRNKDVIATFNWDPFLWQACVRAAQYFVPPRTIFLHGNVAVGYCMTDMIKGAVGAKCNKCGRKFQRSRLLYPVSLKNYTTDTTVSNEWKDVQTALKTAYFVTVFGYSAPRTDIEAMALLHEGWGGGEKRSLEEFSVIDIRPHDEVIEWWKPFLCRHHYGFSSSFYDSWLAHHPRRSCEALLAAVMNNNPYPNHPVPCAKTFDELHDFFEPYIRAEAG